MKTTVRGVVLRLDDNQKTFLDNLMNRYCAAVRWSYKRLLDKLEVQDIRINVQHNFCLNSRQANDAVYDAQTTISVQTKLLNLYYENTIVKVKSIKERMAKTRSPRKIQGLQVKLEKRERRLTHWKKFIDTNTLPPVVFGGKKLFQERCKGKISREKWREARSNRYLSRGDKTKGGNLNTRLYEKDSQIFMDVASDPVQVGKAVRYNRITMPIYLTSKNSKKTGKVNGRNYRQMVLDYLKTGNAYQVEILRKNGHYYVHVTIEEEVVIPYKAHNGVIGVDTNPNGLGISYLDYFGNFRGSKFLTQGEWTYARSNRRFNLIGEQAMPLVAEAKRLGKALVVEDLKFKQDKDVKAKLRRVSSGFVWSRFLAAVERQCAREGVPLIKVKPPYTSVIGILKYQQQYGISNHAAAAYVIGRRGLGFGDEKVPEHLRKFIPKKKLNEFDNLSNWIQWALIKKSILKRKDVKNLSFWQHQRKEIA